jgi:hypothetical protein
MHRERAGKRHSPLYIVVIGAQSYNLHGVYTGNQPLSPWTAANSKPYLEEHLWAWNFVT